MLFTSSQFKNTLHEISFSGRRGSCGKMGRLRRRRNLFPLTVKYIMFPGVHLWFCPSFAFTPRGINHFVILWRFRGVRLRLRASSVVRVVRCVVIRSRGSRQLTVHRHRLGIEKIYTGHWVFLGKIEYRENDHAAAVSSTKFSVREISESLSKIIVIVTYDNSLKNVATIICHSVKFPYKGTFTHC